MKGRNRRKAAALLLCGCMLCSSCFLLTPSQVKAEGIAVDANLADWGGIPAQESKDVAVSSWAVAQDENYLYFSGSEWRDYTWMPHPLSSGGQWVYFKYANGATGASIRATLQIDDNAGTATVINDWYQNVDGATAAIAMTEDKLQATVEFCIPKTFLPDTDYEITYCGITLKDEEIPWTSGSVQPVPEETPEENTTPEETPEENTAPEESGESMEEGGFLPTPVYEGIVIDGKFADWDAIEKTKVNQYGVEESAIVWDGDNVYVYLKPTGDNWNAITWSGPNGNGQFMIKTDLGRELLVQLGSQNDQPTITVGKNIPGGAVAVNSTKWGEGPYFWEFSIPASALPSYNQSISFGYYKSDIMHQDVVNLQGGSQEGAGDETATDATTSIVIDGKYDDWNNYPHTHIDYATAGTQDYVVDAEGALWAGKDKLYGHIETKMEAHINLSAQELVKAVSFRVSQGEDIEDATLSYNARFVTADENGNINWNPQLDNLPAGTYHFYMFDLGCWGTSTNINNLSGRDILYGEMWLTLSDTCSEAEFYLDIPTLLSHLSNDYDNSANISIDAQSAKIYGVQFGRLGQQWITTAGTSTGTWVGLLLCFAAVGIAEMIQRRRKKTRV